MLDGVAQLVHEHAGALAVDEEHAEAGRPLQDVLELAHARRVVHEQLARDRHRQLVHLPEAVGRAREHGQAPRPRPLEPPDVALHALDVLHHRRVGVPVEPGVPHERAEGLLHLAVGGQVTAVDVEVARRDGSVGAPEPSECSNRLLGDGGHANLLRGETAMVGQRGGPPGQDSARVFSSFTVLRMRTSARRLTKPGSGTTSSIDSS